MKNTFISLVSHWSWIMLGIASIFQCIFFWSLPNFMAIGCVALAWLIVTKVFLRANMLNNYPLSTFLILGFTATQFYFPLLFTSLERKPVVFNLEVPYAVFIHSTLSLVVLVIAHALYRLWANSKAGDKSTILTKAGFFVPPSDQQIWLMGIIGLAATVYVYFLSPSIGREVTGSASDKTIQGLVPFSYAPFFIPFSRLYGGSTSHSKKMIPMLGVFTILLFAVSVGRNTRSGFMLGFTSVGFAYGLGLLLGVFKTQLFTLKNALVGVLGFWLITGPMADLGTAMVIVRGQRRDVSGTELLNLTIDAFNDKEAIRIRRLFDNTEENDWDERYLDNIFTARFSNLKFNDASLVQASRINKYDPDMFNYSINYVLGALPTPILKLLNINSNKEEVYSVSIGDYLYNKAGAGSEALGGFRTGHFAGTGMAAFGWWYLAILGVGMIPVYTLFDKWVVNKPVSSARKELQFSFCGILVLNYVFQFLPAESVTITITFLIRGWLQVSFLYFLIFNFTRIISKMLGKSNSLKPASYSQSSF